MSVRLLVPAKSTNFEIISNDCASANKKSFRNHRLHKNNLFEHCGYPVTGKKLSTILIGKSGYIGVFRGYVTTTDHENVYLQYGILWRFSGEQSDVLLHPIGRNFTYTHLTYNLRKFFPIFGTPVLPKNATFTGKTKL